MTDFPIEIAWALRGVIFVFCLLCIVRCVKEFKREA